MVAKIAIITMLLKACSRPFALTWINQSPQTVLTIVAAIHWHRPRVAVFYPLPLRSPARYGEPKPSAMKYLLPGLLYSPLPPYFWLHS